MAAQAATLVHYTRQGTLTEKSRSYTAIYQVMTTDVNDNAVTVAAAADLPQLGDSFAVGNDSDGDAFVTSIAPRETEKRTRWLVTVTWQTVEDQVDKNDKPNDDPESWLPEIRPSTQMYTKAVEKAIIRTVLPGRPLDSEGPVQNSAGTIFVPGLEREVARISLRMMNRRLAFPVNDMFLVGSVNADDEVINVPALKFFYFMTEYSGLLEGIDGVHKIHRPRDPDAKPIHYWEVSYRVLIDNDGWRVEVADRGVHAKADAGDPDGFGGTISPSDVKYGEVPTLRRLTDLHGQPITEPVCLDLKGQPLKPGKDCKYMTYSVQPEKEWPWIARFR